MGAAMSEENRDIRSERKESGGSFAACPPADLPGQAFAEFMRMRGRRTAAGCGTLWYSTSGGFFMSLPLHRVVDPDPADLDRLMWRVRAAGVRFPSETWRGMPGGLYVCRTRPYGIANVHRGMRSKVHRGTNDCQVRRVSESELFSQGFALNLDTLRRQQRSDPEFDRRENWRRLVRAVYTCPGIEAVGAFVGDSLAAYAITCREGGWLHVLHRMSSERLMDHCPNHALDFLLTRRTMEDPGLEAISLGWQSLRAVEGLHVYKLRLGYECVPQNFVIRLQPALKALLANRIGAKALGVAAWAAPRSERINLVSAVLKGTLCCGPAARGVPPGIDRGTGPVGRGT